MLFKCNECSRIVERRCDGTYHACMFLPDGPESCPGMMEDYMEEGDIVLFNNDLNAACEIIDFDNGMPVLMWGDGSIGTWEGRLSSLTPYSGRHV